MPMKLPSKSKNQKAKKNMSVVSLDKFKKTKTDLSYSDPIGRCISAAARVSIVNAANGMYTADIRQSLQNQRVRLSEKVPANDNNKEKLSVKNTKFQEDDPPWENDRAFEDTLSPSLDPERASNDPDILSQDLHQGLKLWLEAYSGIGMDLSKPTSKLNPNRQCPWPPSSYDMINWHNKQAASKKCRGNLGKPILNESIANRPVFRQKKNGTIRSCGVQGWTGPRPPQMWELFYQAYKKGYSFAVAVNRSEQRMLLSKLECVVKPSSPPTTKVVAVEEHVSPQSVDLSPSYYSEQHYAYQQWLVSRAREINNIPQPQPIHLSNIVQERKLEAIYNWNEWYRYRDKLWEMDKQNPHIDYGLEFTTDPVLGFEVYRRESYEGRKAGRFAPNSRFNRYPENILDYAGGDKKWETHLGNYAKYSNGIWNFKELVIESLKLWDKDYDLCLWPGIAYHHELLLPSPPGNDEALNVVSYVPKHVESSSQEAPTTYVEKTRSQVKDEPSGNYSDMTFKFFLAKGWKNLPNMLVQVPEAYNPGMIASGAAPLFVPTHQDIDKICRLKTG